MALSGRSIEFMNTCNNRVQHRRRAIDEGKTMCDVKEKKNSVSFPLTIWHGREALELLAGVKWDRRDESRDNHHAEIDEIENLLNVFSLSTRTMDSLAVVDCCDDFENENFLIFHSVSVFTIRNETKSRRLETWGKTLLCLTFVMISIWYENFTFPTSESWDWRLLLVLCDVIQHKIYTF